MSLQVVGTAGFARPAPHLHLREQQMQTETHTETHEAMPNVQAPATPVNLTESAAAEVRRYIEEQAAAESAGLRVGVLPGGCSGFQYGLNIEDEAAEDDMILESQGIRLFVDPFSL